MWGPIQNLGSFLQSKAYSDVRISRRGFISLTAASASSLLIGGHSRAREQSRQEELDLIVQKSVEDFSLNPNGLAAKYCKLPCDLVFEFMKHNFELPELAFDLTDPDNFEKLGSTIGTVMEYGFVGLLPVNGNKVGVMDSVDFLVTPKMFEKNPREIDALTGLHLIQGEQYVHGFNHHGSRHRIDNHSFPVLYNLIALSAAEQIYHHSINEKTYPSLEPAIKESLDSMMYVTVGALSYMRATVLISDEEWGMAKHLIDKVGEKKMRALHDRFKGEDEYIIVPPVPKEHKEPPWMRKDLRYTAAVTPNKDIYMMTPDRVA